MTSPSPDIATDQTATASVVGINPALFHRVHALSQEIDDLMTRVKDLKIKYAASMAVLVDQFASAGADALALRGVKGTLHAGVERVYVSKATPEVTTADVVAALRASGHEHLVLPESYHSGQLSAWWRDQLRSGAAIPPALGKVMDGEERPYIGFTRTRKRTFTTPASAVGASDEAPA